MGPYKVYVANLPAHVDSEDLSNMFNHVGPIVTAYVVRFQNGRSRNYGFVRFGNARAMESAICMSGVFVGDRQVFVEEAKAQDDAGADWHTLEFDGASRGNPGPAAAGAILYDSAGNEVDWVNQYLGPSFTSNQAEYRALILGLEMALNSGVEQLEIRGDSQLVIRQLRGEYEVRSRRLHKLYCKAQRLLGQFEEPPLLFHISREENRGADNLANDALDEEECRANESNSDSDGYYVYI